MKIHDSFNRVIIPSGIRTEGTSQNLAVDEVAFVESNKVTSKGYRIIEDFSAIPRNGLISVKIGTKPLNGKPRKGQDNLDSSTMMFRLEDIYDMRADSAQNQELKGDIMVLGYNGEEGTGIKLKKDSIYNIRIELKGDSLSRIGLKGNEITFSEVLFSPRDLPSVDNNINKVTDNVYLEPRDLKTIIEKAVKSISKKPVMNGFEFKDFADIRVVSSKHVKDAKKTVKFYTVEVPFDKGTSMNLADIQRQYPELEVRVNPDYVSDNFGSYVAISDSKPEDYKLNVGNSETVYCDCEEEGSKVSGYLYNITGDITEEVIKEVLGDNLVEDSFKELDKNSNKEAQSSFVVKKYITGDKLEVLSKKEGFISISEEHEIEKVCTGVSKEITFEWNLAGEAYGLEHSYKIRIQDTECGNSRLEELQNAYEGLTITEVVGSNLVCMRTYTTKVYTDLSGDKCSPLIYKVFESEAPRPYLQNPWELVEDNTPVDETEEFGIYIEGKTFRTGSDINTHFDMPNNQDFISVDAFISDDPRRYKFTENYDTNLPVKRKKIQKGSKVYGLGQESLKFEIESQNYFTGKHFSKEYPLFNHLAGTEHRLKPNTPYVSYFLSVHKNKGYALAPHTGRAVTYEFMFEIGKHRDFEEYFNKISNYLGYGEIKPLSE